MLLDEFTALGRIPIIAEAISYLPGYNVRVVIVIQTPAQLREVYGIHNAETMLKSLAARIVFAPKDFADAREISDELGFTTVTVRDRLEAASGLLDRPRAAIEEPERQSSSAGRSSCRRRSRSSGRKRPSSSTRACGRSAAGRSAISPTRDFASACCPRRRLPCPRTAAPRAMQFPRASLRARTARARRQARPRARPLPRSRGRRTS